MRTRGAAAAAWAVVLWLTFANAYADADSADQGTAPGAKSQTVEVNETTATKVSQMSCKETAVTGSRLQKRKVCTTPDSEHRSSSWVQSQQERGANESTIYVNGRGG